LWFGDYPTFHEALSFLLDDPAERARMGEKGKDYVLANYSWDEVVRNLAAVLEEGEGGAK
jgi:glycosyltransferase involved in cell wall biosynthesis